MTRKRSISGIRGVYKAITINDVMAPSTDTDMVQGLWIIWPEYRYVEATQLIKWAQDDVANGKHAGPSPTTIRDAVKVLQDTGSVTFHT